MKFANKKIWIFENEYCSSCNKSNDITCQHFKCEHFEKWLKQALENAERQGQKLAYKNVIEAFKKTPLNIVLYGSKILEPILEFAKNKLKELERE